MTHDEITISQLALAVQADDLERVRSILQARPDLVNMDTRDNEHRVIHYAVYNRSPEMVRLLMQSGADARKGLWPIREATTAFLPRAYFRRARPHPYSAVTTNGVLETNAASLGSHTPRLF
jgi:hypothetical protein